MPVPTLAAPANLIRAANCHRQAVHPEEPTTLDFQLAIDSIPPGFLCHDIIVDDCRHVILATDKMILLLSGSKNWYADGTFDVVWKPFTQLFSIHAFVRSDSCIKQVPLMFVIMPGKRKRGSSCVVQDSSCGSTRNIYKWHQYSQLSEEAAVTSIPPTWAYQPGILSTGSSSSYTSPARNLQLHLQHLDFKPPLANFIMVSLYEEYSHQQWCRRLASPTQCTYQEEQSSLLCAHPASAQGSSNNWHRGSTYLRQEVEVHPEEKLSTTARSTVLWRVQVNSWKPAPS